MTAIEEAFHRAGYTAPASAEPEPTQPEAPTAAAAQVYPTRPPFRERTEIKDWLATEAAKFRAMADDALAIECTAMVAEIEIIKTQLQDAHNGHTVPDAGWQGRAERAICHFKAKLTVARSEIEARALAAKATKAEQHRALQREAAERHHATVTAAAALKREAAERQEGQTIAGLKRQLERFKAFSTAAHRMLPAETTSAIWDAAGRAVAPDGDASEVEL